jgi:hypothetical protein
MDEKLVFWKLPSLWNSPKFFSLLEPTLVGAPQMTLKSLKMEIDVE